MTDIKTCAGCGTEFSRPRIAATGLGDAAVDIVEHIALAGKEPTDG